MKKNASKDPEYAKACSKCIHGCKQPAYIIVCQCPFFEKAQPASVKADRTNKAAV